MQPSTNWRLSSRFALFIEGIIVGVGSVCKWKTTLFFGSNALSFTYNGYLKYEKLLIGSEKWIEILTDSSEIAEKLSDYRDSRNPSRASLFTFSALGKKTTNKIK